MTTNHTHPNDMKNNYNHFLDAGQEPRRMLPPIERYQKVPLTSLEEAVESIGFCCPNIHRRVFIAMSKCKNPLDGLNQDESASIYLYTMEWKPKEECLHYVLNETLRNEDRNKLKPWFYYLKLILTALHKLPSQKQTIYRGVRLDLNRQYTVGKRYVWWAFSSCIQSPAVLESEFFLSKNGPRTVFNIECENGKMIRSHSYSTVEDEILLLPATQFEVKNKLNPSPDLYIIELKEVEPRCLLIRPLVTSSSVKSKPDVKNNEEQFSSIYRNEKLEQEIAEYSLNGKVDLGFQKLTDRDVPIVVQRAIIDKKCSELDIRQNKITNEGAEDLGKALRSNTCLQHLCMENNRISDKGARWIAQALHTNTTLTQLNLEENQINSEGAQFLADALIVNSTLKELFLHNNFIGDSGAQYLAQALIRNATLTWLNLSSNEITDEGALHLAQILKRNASLTHLSLSQNLLTDDGIKILMDALCNNHGLQKLWINCLDITNKSMGAIQNMLELNETLTSLVLPEESFSTQEQGQLQAMAKTKQYRLIRFW